MYCKKHKTIHQGQCYECEKEEMDKPIDWDKLGSTKNTSK